MQEFLALVNSLAARHGMVYGTAAAICVCLAWLGVRRFGSDLTAALRHFSHRKVLIVDKKHLLRHQVFLKLRDYAESRIQNLGCHCVLRKRIFGDLMLIRLNLYRKELENFIIGADFHKMPAEFQADVISFLSGFFRDWERAAAEDGIPAVVLNRFVAAIAIERTSLLAVAHSFASDYITGDSNYAQMNRLLDVICGLEEVIIVRLETTLDSMNGEISSLNYKGIECAHCKDCQSTHRPEPPTTDDGD